MKRMFIICIAVSIIILLGLIGVCYQIQMVGKQMMSSSDDSEKWMERMYVENNIYESIRNNDCVFVVPNVSKERPLLVCYYSSLSCGTCVDFAMNKIDEYFLDSKLNPQIIFVASDFNEKTNFERQNTLRLNSRDIEMPISESTLTCYFILHNDTVSHFFIPEKTFENYTDMYLTEIKKKFFAIKR